MKEFCVPIRSFITDYFKKGMLALSKDVRAFELIDDYGEVVANVRQFHKDLESGTYMVGKLSEFKEWFYIPELDAFGPAKYIGYKRMNSVFYNEGHRTPEQKSINSAALNGGASTDKLKRWFRKLSQDEPLFTQLHSKFNSFLSTYDKKANKKLQLFVLKGKCPR